jgi:hypothetical protein
MGWRTYTPDGRTLDVDFTKGTWIATCSDGHGVGTTAAEALSRALEMEATVSTLGESSALETWIAEQATMLEQECAGVQPSSGSSEDAPERSAE